MLVSRAELIEENPEILEQMQAENERLAAERDRQEAELAKAEAERKKAATSSYFGFGSWPSSATTAEEAAQERETASTSEQDERTQEASLETMNREDMALATQEKQLKDFTDRLDLFVLGPLPKPLRNLIKKAILKIGSDSLRLIRFARRQLQAILGVVLQRITDRERQEEHEQDRHRRMGAEL